MAYKSADVALNGAVPAAAATPASSYVRIRGIPFNATEHDVAQWFASAPGGAINVVRVLCTYNNAGRKSGEAVRPSCTHATRTAPVITSQLARRIHPGVSATVCGASGVCGRALGPGAAQSQHAEPVH